MSFFRRKRTKTDENKSDFTIVMSGLDGSGKTTVLNMIRTRSPGKPKPTKTYESHFVSFASVKMLTKVWNFIDVGGHLQNRKHFKHYYKTVNGIIYCIDSCDLERMVPKIENKNNKNSKYDQFIKSLDTTSHNELQRNDSDDIIEKQETLVVKSDLEIEKEKENKNNNCDDNNDSDNSDNSDNDFDRDMENRLEELYQNPDKIYKKKNYKDSVVSLLESSDDESEENLNIPSPIVVSYHNYNNILMGTPEPYGVSDTTISTIDMFVVNDEEREELTQNTLPTKNKNKNNNLKTNDNNSNNSNNTLKDNNSNDNNTNNENINDNNTNNSNDNNNNTNNDTNNESNNDNNKDTDNKNEINDDSNTNNDEERNGRNTLTSVSEKLTSQLSVDMENNASSGNSSSTDISESEMKRKEAKKQTSLTKISKLFGKDKEIIKLKAENKLDLESKEDIKHTVFDDLIDIRKYSLENVVILVLLTKQDLNTAMPKHELMSRLNISKIFKDKTHKIVPLSSFDKKEIKNAVSWLRTNLQKNKPKTPRPKNDKSSSQTNKIRTTVTNTIHKMPKLIQRLSFRPSSNKLSINYNDSNKSNKNNKSSNSDLDNIDLSIRGPYVKNPICFMCQKSLLQNFKGVYCNVCGKWYCTEDQKHWMLERSSGWKCRKCTGQPSKNWALVKPKEDTTVKTIVKPRGSDVIKYDIEIDVIRNEINSNNNSINNSYNDDIQDTINYDQFIINKKDINNENVFDKLNNNNNEESSHSSIDYNEFINNNKHNPIQNSIQNPCDDNINNENDLYNIDNENENDSDNQNINL